MKKFFFVLICFLITVNAKAQFPEGFESSVPPSGWISFIGTNGKGTTENWKTTSISSSGSSAAYVKYENVHPNNSDGEDWLVTPQFTPTSSANILSFAQRQSFTDSYGSIYTVRVSISSQATHSDFTIVDSQIESDFTTIYDIHHVDLSAYNDIPIYVAFVMENDNGDDWFIDDVDLQASVSAPNCVTNQVPADGAVDVDIENGSITISWDQSVIGDLAANYEIYWGSSSGSLTLLGSLINSSVGITNIDYATTYYWKIVPKNFGGSALGCPEMSFTTEGAPSNDDCSGATLVTSLPFNVTQDGGGATNNSGFIVTCSPGMNDGVWYTFTPSVSGTVDVEISNVIGWDPELAIYSGSCGSLTCVSSIDSGLSGTGEILSNIAVVSGVQYWINIGHYSNSSDQAEGTFDLDITGSGVLSIDSNMINDELSIYPNPVKDILHISSRDNIEEIKVFNLLGQEVLNSEPMVLQTEIVMSNLPTGIYFVKVKVGEHFRSYRVVKD